MKILILENIRSAYNVGAMFRTADAAGVDKIFLVGYTPTPIDRFGREQSEIKKTSLGASAEVEWEHQEDIETVIKTLKSKNIIVAAVELAENSILLNQYQAPPAIAYILGNEVEGVSAKALSLADVILEIPMHGMKESLNVSVSAGIVLYHDFK